MFLGSLFSKHFPGKLYSAGNKKILIKTYESNEKYPSKSEKKISGDLDPLGTVCTEACVRNYYVIVAGIRHVIRELNLLYGILGTV